jgi:hypothetical protein
MGLRTSAAEREVSAAAYSHQARGNPMNVHAVWIRAATLIGLMVLIAAIVANHATTTDTADNPMSVASAL